MKFLRCGIVCSVYAMIAGCAALDGLFLPGPDGGA